MYSTTEAWEVSSVIVEYAGETACHIDFSITIPRLRGGWDMNDGERARLIEWRVVGRLRIEVVLRSW
jgi:hypothetical protein